MDRRELPTVKEYLQKQEVQARIQQKTTEVRAKATVTISRAAELFDFTENKLRDWEKRGLLSAERASKQDGKGPAHRQYTPADLGKLAVIQELLDRGYSLYDLEREVEVIWQVAATVADEHAQVKEDQDNIGSLPIDQRLDLIYKETFFFPYFAAQVLKNSLSLISEDIAEARVGMILPRSSKSMLAPVKSPEDVSTLGESLVAWYGGSHWFYLFLTKQPSFEFPSDFRIESLSLRQENSLGGSEPNDRTVLIVPRTARTLALSHSTIETMQRLLAILYQDVDSWRGYFGEGMREVVYPAADFTSSRYVTDPLLNRLADMVVRLGGKTTDNRDRWRFCSILLPKDSSLPLQQRSLVVRAQSKGAPHAVATTTVTSENPGLSLRAYLSGHVIYLPAISPGDPIIAYRSEEEQPDQEPIRSAIAIPIPGEDGLSIAVMYIASGEANAFSKQDQRLLRMIGQMVEELLLTYNVRQTTSKLKDVLANPQIVDPAFKDFLSESDFIRDVEALLSKLKGEMEEWTEPVREEPLPLPQRAERFWEDEKLGVISFMVIDIDNHRSFANKYGSQVARNLSMLVGQRIKTELASSEKYANKPLYHIEADRFYLMLDGISLKEARATGYQLKQALRENYRVITNGGSDSIDIDDVSVRVGVSAYPYMKLRELLRRNLPEDAIAQVRSLITTDTLNSILAKKQEEDKIISFLPTTWGYGHWFPSLREESF